MRAVLFAMTLAIATSITLAPQGSSANHETNVHSTQWGSALYGENDGMARVLAPEVMWNTEGAPPPGEPLIEWRVGRGNSEVLTPMLDSIVGWNNVLRSGSNTLGKYPFHYHSSFDLDQQTHIWPSTTNVRVWSVPDPSTLQYFCGVRPPSQRALGCVRDSDDGPSGTNLELRPFYIFISQTLENGTALDQVAVLEHELGHVLFYNEHYANPSGCDNSWTNPTIMNAYSCQGNYRVGVPHDSDDFYGGYKPQDTPGAGTMAINSSAEVETAWDASYGLRHNVSRYVTVRYTDTNGSVLGWDFDNATPERGIPAIDSRTFSSLGSDARFCNRTYSVSDAGYSFGPNLGPPTFYGCARKWSGPVQPGAGPFVATSHRVWVVSRVQVANYSGVQRKIQVFGPNLASVGCALLSVVNNGTYSCDAGVGILRYPYLDVFVWDTSDNLVAYAQLDFE